MKPIEIRTVSLISIILLTALSRLLPHWPNFTPIAAIALFGTATFHQKWQGLLISLGAMLVSDALIGFHDDIMVVYGSFVGIWSIGFFLLRRVTPIRMVMTSLLSSIFFFLTTNFAVWYGSQFYPQTGMGLLSSYLAGLAFYNGQSFFLNGLLGDLFFNTLLFGVYSVLIHQFPILRPARQ